MEDDDRWKSSLSLKSGVLVRDDDCRFKGYCRKSL